MANRPINRREFMKFGAVGMLGSTITFKGFQEADTNSLKESLPQEVFDQMSDQTLQQVTIQQVHCDQSNNIPVVELQDETGRMLHIYVGIAEGNAIRTALEQQTTPRPMTHDTMRNLIETGGMQVEAAVITKLEQTTFYALLLIRTQGELKPLDCRPSDAMALALRTDSPIYANQALL